MSKIIGMSKRDAEMLAELRVKARLLERGVVRQRIRNLLSRAVGEMGFLAGAFQCVSTSAASATVAMMGFTEARHE